MLGYPSLGASLSPYSSLTPYQSGLYGTTMYQPGFYSIYLPGYTHRPLFLGLPVSGLGRSIFQPTRVGLPGSALPRPPLTRPVIPPAPAHPVVHVVGHK
jgi:hypothetical protein